METQEWMCECDSSSCQSQIGYDIDEMVNRSSKSTVQIPMSLAIRLHRDMTLFLIVDSCKVGCSPKDTFVEKGDGYTLYRGAAE